ncbi:MAG: hypothetical protein ACE5ED_06130 [Rhodothalassiaceae bacterium]
MDNPLIALGSFLAVALLVLLNWWLGGWRQARIEDAARAAERYRTDFWNDEIDAVAVDADGRAALIAIAGPEPAAGLVVAHGDAFVTRRLAPGSVTSTVLGQDGRLDVRLDDLVLPRVRLRLDGREAERWQARLEALARRRTGDALQGV